MRSARPLLSSLAIAELSERKETTASSGWGGRGPRPGSAVLLWSPHWSSHFMN